MLNNIFIISIERINRFTNIKNNSVVSFDEVLELVFLLFFIYTLFLGVIPTPKLQFLGFLREQHMAGIASGKHKK